MAESVVPIYVMLICNNKHGIFLGQNYNTLWTELQYTLDSLCDGYFLDILNNSQSPGFSCYIRFHRSLPNVSCVSNILPRLIKLTLLYKVLWCRLVWLTDFLEIQSAKGDICYKRREISEKSQILCTFVAFFLLKYRKLANITTSFCFVETWVLSEQDMALIKSIISDLIIVLDKHVLEKISIDCLVCSIYLVTRFIFFIS